VHLVGSTKEIYYNARPYESQVFTFLFLSKEFKSR